MSELLPTTQARDLQDGLVDFLRTTFALADADAQAALEDFLRHATEGIFKGPYVRLRLPFRPADPGWESHLDWNPAGFVPYGHQAAAFARLTNRPEPGSGKEFRQPQPTLVTTGTGSGKTEAFLYPILDHVLRARRAGITGVKALILYPMNALASDQAGRLAGLITGDPRLGQVTAALYTGDSGAPRTMVSAGGLITDRHIIRDDPPDVLLTNYKMLDQLLLRAEDQLLWRQSAHSLTYLVLDEFHTYDGAQGTDVAMLLRRLALALTDVRGQDHRATDEPLAGLVPVATSATLGDAHDADAMITFASTAFGVPFDASCVVGESRQTSEEWAADAAARVAAAGLTPRTLAGSAVARLNADLDGPQAADSAALTRTVLGQLYDSDNAPARAAETDLVRAHPQLRNLVEAPTPVDLDDLARTVLPLDTDPGQARMLVANLVAALSHVRATHGRSEVSVETHLWVRELTRIDRVASTLPRYRWSDDGTLTLIDGADVSHRPAFPAIYCRHCGRSGWGIELAATGLGLSADDRDIRSHHAAGEGRFRALIHAPQEALADPVAEGLVWFDVRARQVRTHPPGTEDEDLREGWLLPVLTLLRAPEEDSRNDRCPACDQPDGIRFLGSSIATLLSVSLSALFGSPHLEQREKKALVFTDSVQDAAHRAGFVESRSHTLTLRTATRSALNTEPVSVDLLAEEMMRQAGDPFARYRLLAPDLVGRPQFDPFWRSHTVPNATRQAVRRRLLFDLICEFGVHSRIGRTLEATGSVLAEADAGTVRLDAVGRAVLAETDHQRTLLGAGSDDPPSDQAVTAWVRGTLERLRTQGAIYHDWLDPYLTEDGTRYRIWGGRARNQGMPAFPTGRTAPAFPRVGPTLTRTSEMLLDSVTSPQSWYARWAARVLGVPAGHGARLARGLLERLHRADVLITHTTNSQATVYALPAGRVVVAAADADGAGLAHRLRCSLCHTEQAGSATVVEQLDGAPCLLVRCTGTLTRVPLHDNYYRRLYRSANPKRVVAREHTSLLGDRTRAAYEAGFKAGHEDPAAPNVLVATPTLEMGIDIGDLSSVMLASLPRHVAAYLQRVGRAGRLTGNSLNLAFVTGRGQHLPRLGEPLSLINGPVRPPATYLSAEEILRRQYFASLVDAFARDDDRPHPRSAPAAIGSVQPTSFLGQLTAWAEAEAPRLLDGFLGQLSGVTAGAEAELRRWAVAPAGPGSSGLAQQTADASRRWQTTVDGLRAREAAIQAALPELLTRAESPAAAEDDKRAARSAEAALRQTGRALGVLRGTYWVGVLEEYGLLPNYTLVDDSVTLDVALSWLDPETQQYDSVVSTHKRGSAAALHEFAPGATFYTNGLQIEIDALDLGIDASRIQPWSFCAACGYARADHEVARLDPCPRCGSGTITDTRQRFDVVEMTRVSAQAHRDEARINDRDDERKRARFTVVSAADIDPEGLGRQWFIRGYDFGARYLRRLTIRWLNLGPRVGYGTVREVAGWREPGNLFRVCAGCGVLDRATRANRPDEHRAWCRYRSSTDEHSETVLLSRTLTTQGVVIPLPWSISLGDPYAVPSLAAAVLLGLHQLFGGSPDHIGVTTTIDPVIGGDNREALLLHDLVPGGTGYLAELASPANVWRMLRTAWDAVASCACAGAGRLACHRCLLPYAPRQRPDAVSRVAAERHLRAILTGGQGGEPGEEMTWVCTTEEPAPATSIESHLEQHFRRRFTELARELSGTLTEQPTAYGNSLHLGFPSVGGRSWLLEPQVQLPAARPDFVLRCTDVQVPPVAIFTDGYAYHADTDGALAADARQRRDLADAGYLVLAVTAEDLRPAPAAPSWFSGGAWPLLVGRARTVVPLQETLISGPMAFLTWWLTDPDPARQQALSDVLPLMMAAGRTPIPVDASRPLTTAAADLQDGRNLAAGAASALVWQQGALIVVARLTTTHGSVALEIAAVLDDRPEARLDPGFRAAWQDWLRLANALQRHTIAVSVATRQQLAAEEPALSRPDQQIRLDVAWQSTWDQMLDDEGRTLVESLAIADVEPPSRVGDELGVSFIPADLIWDAARVAVVIHPAADDVADLRDEGWTVVAAEAETVRAALRKASKTS